MTNTSLPSIREVASLLGGDVAGPDRVQCPGPGHSPQDRSLSIKLDRDAPDGFVTYSHAGDDALKCKDYVRAKIGIDEWKPRKPETERKIIAAYDYLDEDGSFLFQVVRFDPKDFRQRRSDGHDGWIWSIGNAPRVLYRLPDLLEAIASDRPVFIAEGEKAVDALVQLGVTATCSPGGAGKWRDQFSEHLKGADVVILPDNDEPGELHAKSVRHSLGGNTDKVRVLRLPGLPEKGDPYDWIQAGGTVEKLWQLVENGGTEATAQSKAPPEKSTHGPSSMMLLISVLSGTWFEPSRHIASPIRWRS
jgi:hypothetical protein